MSDYNPKNIPTLDDIIEKDVTGNTETAIADGIVESDDAGTEAAAYDINLFLAESESDTGNTVIAETEPQLGDLNDIPDAEPADTDAVQYVNEETCETSVFLSEDKAEDDPDNTESALTDYNEDNDSIIDVQSIEATPQVSVEPLPVGLIVKDIVKQLMPDLEQQLVFLLQQAIEEKLPEEIIKSTDTEHEN